MLRACDDAPECERFPVEVVGQFERCARGRTARGQDVVVSVGEKISKSHLTYAPWGSAERVAMTIIGAGDMFGLPLSTTHVLSSGVAGRMAANRSGVQWSTIRNLRMAGLLTLPVAILLLGSLYGLFTHLS